MLRLRTAITTEVGGPQVSTMFFDGADASAAEAAATAVTTFWSNLASMIVDTTTMQVESQVDLIELPTGQATDNFSVTLQPVVAGDNPAEQAPSSTQGLIQWRTGSYVNGRNLRGRTFVPTPPTGVTENGRPMPVYIAALDAAASNLVADATDLMVYSRTHTQAVSVAAATVWTEWAILRSRRD